MDKVFAKITRVQLTKEDHDILTCYISLSYDDGGGQGFGGYALDQWSEEDGRRVGTAAGLDYILQILKCFGASRLDELVGRTVIVMCDDSRGWTNRKVLGLEVPGFDDGGGNHFTIAEWQKRWGCKP